MHAGYSMDYSWVLLSLIAAFTLATSDALTKKTLTSHNEYIVAWLRLVFSLPFFLIFISYIVLGERVSSVGATGILFIAAGSYALHISKIREGIFEPLRAITRERGSVLMIGVALIYSLTSTLGKVAIQHSSPLFFGSTYFTALALFFAPIAFYKNKEKKMENKTIFSVILPGIFYSLMVVSHMIAISLAKVAYVISVKRMSLIIGVLYGYLFFKEKNIGERFIGASLMFIGFIMVVTAS